MKHLAENASRTFVVVKGERIDVEDVEFLNIEEGIFGEDIMTFEYESEVYESAVFRH